MNQIRVRVLKYALHKSNKQADFENDVFFFTIRVQELMTFAFSASMV